MRSTVNKWNEFGEFNIEHTFEMYVRYPGRNIKIGSWIYKFGVHGRVPSW